MTTLLLGGCDGGNSRRAEPSLGGQDGEAAAAGDQAGGLPVSEAVPPPVACELQDTLRFGWVGGMVPERERHVLEPPDQYRRRREVLGETTRTCSLTLPACGSPGVADPEDILEALGDSQVVQAFSGDFPTFFGRDLRPVDGQAWRLQWSGAGEVLLGQPCGGEAGCVAIVPELDSLRHVLERLAREMGTRCGGSGGP